MQQRFSAPLFAVSINPRAIPGEVLEGATVTGGTSASSRRHARARRSGSTRHKPNGLGTLLGTPSGIRCWRPDRLCDSPSVCWRRRPDLNRRWRFCRPLPYHLATAPRGRPHRGDRALMRRTVPDEKRAPTARSARPLPRRARGEEMERETGFEPATSTLARSHSTTELFPLN